MEALSIVRTIVGMAQDIVAALETASGNKTRCGRIARRLRRLRAVVLELNGAEAGTTDTAMRSLLEELEEALRRALEQVRRCQRTGFLRVVVAGGARMADPLDEVERDIDRCVQDLGLASYVRLARLENRLRQQNVATEVATGSVPDDKNADRVRSGGAEKDGEEDATAAEDVPATGVPIPVLCTVAAGMREHGANEIVTLPSSSHGHGYCCWHFSHGHGHGTGTCDCWHYKADCPSDAASYYYTQHPPYKYPSVFSDDNPNACIIL